MRVKSDMPGPMDTSPRRLGLLFLLAALALLFLQMVAIIDRIGELF